MGIIDFKIKKRGELPGIRALYGVIIAAIAVLFVINFVINVVWLKSFANSLRQQRINYEYSQAKKVAQTIEYEASESISNVKDLAYDISLLGIETENAENGIQYFLKNNYHIREVSIVNMDGDEIERYSRGKLITSEDLKNFSGLDKFEMPREGMEFVGAVDYSNYAEPYFTISLPIVSYDSENPRAILMADFYLRGMWEMALETKIGETGEISIIDEKGILVANPRPSKALKKLNYISQPSAKSILSGSEYIGGKYFNKDEMEVIAVGLPLIIEGKNWGLIVEQQAAEIESPISRINSWLIVFLLGNLMIAVILVWLAFIIKSANRELIIRNQILEKEKEKVETEGQKTRSIVDNIIDPILVVDYSYRLIHFNPAAKKIFGLNYKDLGKMINRKSKSFSFNDFRGVIRTDFENKIIEKGENGMVSLEEVTVLPLANKLASDNVFGVIKNDEYVYKVMTASVCNEKGECYGFMKTFQDLTREKRIDRLKSEFISIAAHQLRTPLSAIKWVMKMLLDEDSGMLSREQKDLLSKGYQSNERVIRLVNDLLNVSRIEEGRFGYEYDKFDFNEVLEIINENIKEKLRENNIKIDIKKPEGAVLVEMDKEKILLALQNIVDNAVKYTPEFGKIEIRTETDPSSDYLKFVVKDNGVGIPQKEQPKLFTKFFRASNVVRMETEGSGLGLFIVRNILENHQGTISIESEEGKGTEVIIILPIKKMRR